MKETSRGREQVEQKEWISESENGYEDGESVLELEEEEG